MNNFANFGQYFASIQQNMSMFSVKLQDVEKKIAALTAKFEEFTADVEEKMKSFVLASESVNVANATTDDSVIAEMSSRLEKIEESFASLDSIFSQLQCSAPQPVDNISQGGVCAGGVLTLDDEIQNQITNVETTSAKKKVTKKK